MSGKNGLGPVKKIPIKDICFDHNNPRIRGDLFRETGKPVKKLNQDDLLKHYLNVEKKAFKKWKQSIQINGVLDPIFVIRAPKNYPCKYVVKEGNVRLAILKYLTEEQEKGKASPPNGVRWDIIPARTYKEGTNDKEISLHLLSLANSKNIILNSNLNQFFTKYLNQEDFPTDLRDSLVKAEKDKYFVKNYNVDFTRRELETIAIKLGLGKPPKTMNTTHLKLVIKYFINSS